MTTPFEHISIADLARFPRPGMAMPMRLGFTPDGSAVTYLASAGGNLVLSLWAHDLATGETRILAGPPPASTDEAELSREEELRRERARLRELGVTSYQFARDASPRVTLIPSGGILRVAIGDGPFAEIPGTEGALDARLSRDGTQVAFVRDGELWVAGVPGGQPRQLTSGAEEGLTNGAAEFIAAEELDRSEGFWWSPDGARLAFVRADSRHIAPYPIVHQGSEKPDVETHRYPFAGDPNALIDLGVIDLASGETVWMDLGVDRDIYLARVTWRPDGVLTAQVLSRDQRRLTLLAFDEAGRARTLLVEETSPWVNLHSDLRFLPGGEFLWSSERTGFRHLYFYDANGAKARQLTTGDWMATRVVGVDEDRRDVYFEGTRESVLERHLYRVSLDGGEVMRLTTAPGWHATVVPHNCSHYLDIHSSRTQAPVVTLRPLGEGVSREPRVLFDNSGMTARSIGLTPPLVFTLSGADGSSLDAALYFPTGNPDALPPVIVSVYGGPHAQRVMDEWSMTVDLRAQYLARQGFAVVRVDNRGSAGRGLAFEAPLHRAMGTIEVADQAAAVRDLAARGIVDGDRVGIFGWSYGGYMTIMCMLREPSLFKVGVAGAPVSDWDGYDTGYTERYMETPAANPDGYREGSALTHAANLDGKLLLVHGGVDENVHFRHTARMVTALTRAGKDYDLLVFPEERHMPRDAKGMEYQERRLVEYFKAYL